MGEAENKCYWYRPKDARDAVDTLDQIASVIAFLSDALLVEEWGKHLELSAEGAGGLNSILSFIEDTMKDSIELITEQQKTI